METNSTEKYMQLGKTGINISPLGIGTWQWGDRFYWKNDNKTREKDINDVFKISLDAGINLFDTAEVYGLGRSEKILARLMKNSKTKIVVATKYMPFPWRIFRWNLHFALKNSLHRLGLESVDLYQIHFPLPPVPPKVWIEELAKSLDKGLIKAAGVSNFDLSQTKEATKILETNGHSLASNQVRYSLIDRSIEKNGVLEYCLSHNITVLAYSPLGQGMLTGKYTPDNLPPGMRANKYNSEYLTQLQPLINTMREIQKQRGKSLAQIALNWVIKKGAVPIPGAKNTKQAKENAGALSWSLDESEVIALDKASERYINQ